MSEYPPEGSNPPGGGYPPGAGNPPGGGYPPPGGGYPPPGSGYPPAGSYPPPGSGFASVQPPKVRPGRLWYLVALALFAAGLAWLIVGIVNLGTTVNDLQRVPLPAGGTISFSSSGSYTVYYEGPGSQSNQIPPYNIHVTPASAGAAVSGLTTYGSSVTYNIGSHHGRAVLTLHVTKPGRFRVSATGRQGTGADLAFGGSIANGVVGVLLPGVPLMIIGVLAAVLLLIIRIVRKRGLQRQPYAPFVSAPGGGSPPG
jgi:hypothetical protein